jgi:hypothetical protein
MKKIIIQQEIKLDFVNFVKEMEKGYSGGGNDKEFTFSTFGGKPSNLVISQKVMMAYNSYVLSKGLLTELLKDEK